MTTYRLLHTYFTAYLKKADWFEHMIQFRTISLVMFCLSFWLFSTPSYANTDQTIDSLKKLINTAPSDTSVCHAYLLWGEELYLTYPDSAVELWLQARAVAKENIDMDPPPAIKNVYLDKYSSALNNIGYIYDDQGKIQKALQAYLECLKIKQEVGNKDGVATALNNIGYIYKNLGDIATGLEFYHKSLKLREELGNMQDVANSLNNIGSIYDDQGDIETAQRYYEECLNIYKSANDVAGIALIYSNLGLLFKNQGDQTKALDYMERSLELREDINHRYGIAVSLNNLGAIYSAKGDDEKALEYFYKCMKIEEEIGDKNGMAHTLNYMGNVYLRLGDVSWAKNIGNDMMDISEELGNPRLISHAALLLKSTSTYEGNFKEALTMYELHIQMRDSINNEATQKATVRQQTKYEFEKAQLVNEQEEKDALRLEDEATSRRDNLQYSVIFITILFLFGGILMLGFIRVSERAAEGIIFFSFLILFEFVLVLADPYIDVWSGGAPGIKLLFNAGIAGLIFPLHAFFETKLKGNLPAAGRAG